MKDVQKNNHIGLVQNDSWLEPFEDAIRGRHEHALWKIGKLTNNGKKSLSAFAVSSTVYSGRIDGPAKKLCFAIFLFNMFVFYVYHCSDGAQTSPEIRCKYAKSFGHIEFF